MFQKMGLEFILFLISLAGVSISGYYFISSFFNSPENESTISKLLRVTPTADSLPNEKLYRINFDILNYQDIMDEDKENEFLEKSFITGVMSTYQERSGARVAFSVMSFSNEKHALKTFKKISREISNSAERTLSIKQGNKIERVYDSSTGADLTFFQKENYLAFAFTIGQKSDRRKNSLSFAKSLVRRMEAG